MIMINHKRDYQLFFKRPIPQKNEDPELEALIQEEKEALSMFNEKKRKSRQRKFVFNPKCSIYSTNNSLMSTE